MLFLPDELRRSKTDYSKVSILTSEADKSDEHKPAMITNSSTIKIIPSDEWHHQPSAEEMTELLSHESIHILLTYLFNRWLSDGLDNIPRRKPKDRTYGVFGWGIYGWRQKLV